jgi:hypothetical protein
LRSALRQCQLGSVRNPPGSGSKFSGCWGKYRFLDGTGLRLPLIPPQVLDFLEGDHVDGFQENIERGLLGAGKPRRARKRTLETCALGSMRRTLRLRTDKSLKYQAAS